MGRLLKNRTSGAHATVHAEVKRQFNVPRYQLIPEKDFPAVVEFPADWSAMKIAVSSHKPGCLRDS